MKHKHVDTAQGDFGGSLYTCFAGTIFTYLSQQVPNEQDAEDLLLEVYLAALKNDSLSTMSAPSQLAWLRRVARNKVIDRYRHITLLALFPITHPMTIQNNHLTPQHYPKH